MKKILLSLGALAALGTTTANADLLIGVEYNAMSSMTQTNEYSSGRSYEHEFTYQPVMFKVGLGTPGENYMYIYYQTATKEYDEGGESLDLMEFGYDYVGQFDVGVKNFHPFWQFGAAYGAIDLANPEYYDQDSRYAVSVKLGAGASYYVLPQVELLAGVHYQYRFYQDIDYGYTTQTTNDSGVNVFVGVNFWPFASDNSSSAMAPAAQPAPAYESTPAYEPAPAADGDTPEDEAF